MADPEGIRGFAQTPSPPPVSKYLMISETKLFHFHSIFKKNEIKSAKRTHNSFIHMNPLSRIPGSAPERIFKLILLKIVCCWYIYECSQACILQYPNSGTIYQCDKPFFSDLELYLGRFATFCYFPLCSIQRFFCVCLAKAVSDRKLNYVEQSYNIIVSFVSL